MATKKQTNTYSNQSELDQDDPTRRHTHLHTRKV